MKAIRKSDGKIIDVEVHGWRGDCPISYHTNFKQYYKPEELDFNVQKEFEQSEQSNSFDWKSFRAEAAKDFVAALIPVIDYEHTTDKIIVDNAISLSEELIKQLKERG